MMQKFPVRLSQLISTWGVGQMIPFPEGDSLMICGLDAWEVVCYKNLEIGYKEFEIHDTRLAARLGVAHFRKPPDFREKHVGITNTNIRIPVVRFPRWHYCPNCGLMEKLSLYAKDLEWCQRCRSGKRFQKLKLIPIYFVAVCEDGHIEDFPFYEWVHHGQVITDHCRLSLQTGPVINVNCSCGAKASMSNMYQDGALKSIKTCSGERPWLGQIESKANGCGRDLKVVQVGASNAYFPLVASSLFLPRYESAASEEVMRIITKKWDFIDKYWKNGNGSTLPFESLEAEYGIPKDEFKRAAQDYLHNYSNYGNLNEEEYRYQEYQAIIHLEGGVTDEFFAKEIPIEKYDHIISQYFSRVICIHKLRETRAFFGFSRVLPQDGKEPSEYKKDLMINHAIEWLPAFENRGEGIFIEFREKNLNYWFDRKDVQIRFKKIFANFNAERERRKLPILTFDARYVLLHTFAHILIRQLSFVCGYNASSIRERIYCSKDLQHNRMSGILIYTASSDTEGSLGGLVHQGRPSNLELIILSVLQSASWCSADPICIESQGQGVDGSNLGACHNCALLPETSCEKGNRLLDRGMMMGFSNSSESGYFSSYGKTLKTDL